MTARSILIDVGQTALLAVAPAATLMATDHLFHGALARHFCTYLLMSFGPIAFFSLLERVVPAGGRRKSCSQWLLNLRIGILGSFIGLLVGTLVTTAVAAVVAALGPHFHFGLIDLRFGNGIVAILGAIVLSAIISDFFFYWYHRLEHKSKWLWQVHKFHHMDQQLDVLTDSRHNWFETVISQLFMTVPMMVLFKFDETEPLKLGLTVGIAIGALNAALDNLVHFNARWHFGRFGHLLVGPQNHRIHHSRLLHHRDKNFAAFFTPWDILFGTYYAPAREEFPPTGVDGEREVQSALEAHTLAQREWWNMFQTWRQRTPVSAN